MAKLKQINASKLYAQDTPKLPHIKNVSIFREEASAVFAEKEGVVPSDYVSENPFNKELVEAKVVEFLCMAEENRVNKCRIPGFAGDTESRRQDLISILVNWLKEGFVSREDLIHLNIPQDLCQFQSTYLRVIINDACVNARLPGITERDLVAAGMLK